MKIKKVKKVKRIFFMCSKSINFFLKKIDEKKERKKKKHLELR